MNEVKMDKILVIGIGNDTRADDGLGWAFLDSIEKEFETLQLDYKYQLNIEDAELISGFDRVFIVDASTTNLPRGYQIEPLYAMDDFAFSTHELNPSTILYLCQSLYSKYPETYLIQIQGDKWDISRGLSKKAQMNLNSALNKFLAIVCNKNILQVVK